MQAMIIGNAPSLIGKNRGKDIDNFDGLIIRTTQIKWQIDKYPEDYGTRIDYLCCTAIQFGFIIKEQIVPDKETWMYNWSKSRHNNMKFQDAFKKYKVQICNNLIMPWVKKLNASAGYYGSKLSKGCAAGLILMQKIKTIQKIILAACDNLSRGDNEKFMRKNKFSIIKSFHDFRAENIILNEAAKKYNIKLEEFCYENA
jgi:hypothetical protein